MTTRYIVNDVEAAIEFYTGLLGFDLKQQAGAAFAIVQRDDLALMLTGPAASAQRPMAVSRRLAAGTGFWSK